MFNDKILGYHFLVHEGYMIMMFHRNQKVVTQNFISEPTGDKYFNLRISFSNSIWTWGIKKYLVKI